MRRQRLAKKSESPEIGFAWQGGEPTLMGVDFFRRVVGYQQKYADGRKVTNAFQTNGTLLDDEWCAFFKQNEFLIGLSIDGFKLAAGEPGQGLEPILHSTKFILVDREGQIRAYYDGGDPEELETLERDAKRLLRE